MRSTALLFLAVVTAVPTAQAGIVVRVKNGVLVDGGIYVGNTTSELAKNVVNNVQLFPAVSSADWEGTSMINASLLRYLVLEGDYLADVPLQLPSLFVLQLDGATTIKPAPTLPLSNTSRFTALVELRDAHFSAVVGGTIDASSLPASAYAYPDRRGYQAITIVGGANNAVRHATLRANNTDAAVSVNTSPNAEIAYCDVGGGPSGQGQTKGRCIWTIATSRALVHDNRVRNCSSHALDFDAYTSASAAWSNLCEDNGEEGIFVEETASGNFVFNNTLRRNGCGIGVYSNAVGPVDHNLIVANVAEGNAGNAITAGGYGHDPRKISSGNIFAANIARDNAGHNGGQYNAHHGATAGDLWTGNSAESMSVPAYAPSLPNNASAVVVTLFDQV